MVGAKRSKRERPGRAPNDHGVIESMGRSCHFQSRIVVVWMAFWVACGCSDRHPVTEPGSMSQ
jgi:hypothetical protein